MELFKKLGIAGGSIFSFSILVCFIIFPQFIKSQVKKQSALKQGSEMRELWEDLPFPLDFKIYLFNITNPAEIKAGAKPIVQQVGPFFYDEYKQKANVIDRDEDDTVEFSFKLTWHFNPAKSAPGLTENIELTFPHMMILSLIMATVREKPAMAGLVAKAVDSIFHKPDSVFIKATARDILWDGLPVDCSVKDFAGSAVCSILRENDDSLIKDGPDRYKFALFGHKNGTPSTDRIRVIRGIKDIFQVGMVTEFNGAPKLNTWIDEGNCNVLNGTDSTVFHPYLYKNEDITSFSADLCRSMGAKFQKRSSVSGISTNRYTIGLGDMSKEPELKCFCQTNTTCLKKGLYDLFNCNKAPIIASLPHLYLVDDEYLQQVDGLHPNEKDHEIFLEFEPITGSPLSARQRLQFNMFIHPVEKVKLMKTFPNALLPLFWIEEGILLGDDILKPLKSLFKITSIVGYIKWTFLVLGLGLGGGAGGLYYKAQQAGKKLEITKIAPKMAQNANGSEKNWPAAISTIHRGSIPPNLDG